MFKRLYLKLNENTTPRHANFIRVLKPALASNSLRLDALDALHPDRRNLLRDCHCKQGPFPESHAVTVLPVGKFVPRTNPACQAVLTDKCHTIKFKAHQPQLASIAR